MNKNIIITIVLLIVVGAGAFYGGMQYQKMQLVNGSSGQLAGKGNGQGGLGRRFGGQNGQNGSAVRGQITSVDTNSVTVQMRDGSSKIVLFSNTTNISKAATGSATDLTKGVQVMAVGTNNSDGSVTAQFIQLNPVMMNRTGKNSTGTQPQGQ